MWVHKSNSGPLEKHTVLLTIELSPAPDNSFLNAHFKVDLWSSIRVHIKVLWNLKSSCQGHNRDLDSAAMNQVIAQATGHGGPRPPHQLCIS